MYELVYDDDKRISATAVKNFNFFHFRGVAFSKVNDFIFRKRLLVSSWKFRRKILTDIRNFFSSGNDFDTTNFKMEIANLKRDFILLFGSEKEVTDQLILETHCLPQNQKPAHHDLYALVTELVELRDNSVSVDMESKFETSSSEHLDNLLDQNYDMIDRNTPKVSETWGVYSIETSLGKRLGRKFVAPSTDAASLFFEEVTAALSDEESGKEISSNLVGLRPFQFLVLDPLLQEAKIKEIEKEIVLTILEHIQDRRASEITGVGFKDPNLDTKNLASFIPEET